MNNGFYRAVAKEAKLGTTGTNKEQVAVLLETMHEETGELTGETITWFGYFTEKATERTLESLRLLGWQGSDLADLSTVGTKEVVIVVEAEEYKGVWRPKVKWINDPESGGIALKAPLDDAKAKQFAAKMKGTVLAFDKKASAPKVNGSPLAAAKKAKPSGGVLSPEPPPFADSDDVGF